MAEKQTAAEKKAAEAAAAEKEAAEKAAAEQEAAEKEAAEKAAAEADAEAEAVTAAAKASLENDGDGKDSGPKYKLANGGLYVDIYTGWTLKGDEAQTIPANVSPQTLERIKSGYIVKA